MSIWELQAAIQGWNLANGTEPQPQPPTPDEHDALVEKYRSV